MASSPGVDAAPAIALACWRAPGQVLDIGPDALRLQADETRHLLNQSMSLGPTEAQVQALDARTEGWPAGLQMAAAALTGPSDASRCVRCFSGSHRLVQDYRLEKVLQRQPAEVQAIRLRTSVLDRLCPALCDAVLQPEAMFTIVTMIALGHLQADDNPLHPAAHPYRRALLAQASRGARQNRT